MLRQSDDDCTILLVRRGARDPQQLVALVAANAREGRVRLWVGDQPAIEGMAQSAFAAVVAVCGDASHVRHALDGYDILESQATGAIFKAADATVGGVSMIALMESKDGLGRADFIAGWRQHAPLALTVHHGALRYVQYELINGGRAQLPYVGMAELLYASRSAVEPGMFRGPDDVKLIQDDVAHFMGAADVFLGSHHDFTHNSLQVS